MRIPLSSLVLASAAIAATALAVPAAQAATVSATTLNVPFNFTVNGETLPAGAYLVQRENTGNFIRLASQNGKQTFNWIARSGDSARGQVTLRFDERGQSHELRSIEYGSYVTPRIDRKRNPRETEVEQIVAGQ